MNRRGIILALLLAVLCLVLCSGCGEKILSGEVMEYRTDESGALSALVVKPETGERVGLLLSEESWVWALTEGITAEEFAAEQPEGVYVSAETSGRAQTITAGDGTEIDAYPVETVKITALRTDTVFPPLRRGPGRFVEQRLEQVLPPGGRHGASLEDGSAEVPSGNLQANTDLSEKAKTAISTYYREQGLLYDVPELLETAYQDYLREGDAFDSYHAGQSISQSAVTERVAYFTTAVTLPLDSQEITEVRLSAAFDRETGRSWRWRICLHARRRNSSRPFWTPPSSRSSPSGQRWRRLSVRNTRSSFPTAWSSPSPRAASPARNTASSSMRTTFRTFCPVPALGPAGCAARFEISLHNTYTPSESTA